VTFLAVDVSRKSEAPGKAREFMRKAGYTINGVYWSTPFGQFF
jgi:hypothetical protein